MASKSIIMTTQWLGTGVQSSAIAPILVMTMSSVLNVGNVLESRPEGPGGEVERRDWPTPPPHKEADPSYNNLPKRVSKWPRTAQLSPPYTNTEESLLGTPTKGGVLPRCTS